MQGLTSIKVDTGHSSHHGHEGACESGALSKVHSVRL